MKKTTLFTTLAIVIASCFCAQADVADNLEPKPEAKGKPTELVFGSKATLSGKLEQIKTNGEDGNAVFPFYLTTDNGIIVKAAVDFDPGDTGKKLEGMEVQLLEGDDSALEPFNGKRVTISGQVTTDTGLHCHAFGLFVDSIKNIEEDPAGSKDVGNPQADAVLLAKIAEVEKAIEDMKQQAGSPNIEQKLSEKIAQLEKLKSELGVVPKMVEEKLPAADAPAENKGESKQPARIKVQHCLIGFQGSVPGPTRSKEEAKELAESLLQKLKDGANFDEIIKEYTNDSSPGIYEMVNFDIANDSNSKTYPRNGMIPAFGNVGFDLKVGEYGMAEHHLENSPFGWHIIKRLE